MDMFIWFVFRDHATSLWQSGLRTRSGAAKPSLARFTAAAASADVRNAPVQGQGGRVPTVTVPAPVQTPLAAKSGRTSASTCAVMDKGKLVTSAQPSAPFKRGHHCAVHAGRLQAR